MMPRPLYACIRATRDVELPLTIAKAFSPRVQRHGPKCVVCDVSGLERLLGNAEAIGTEMQRAGEARGAREVSIAIASTQIASLILSIARPPLAIADGSPIAALSDVPLPVLRQLLAELHGVTFLRTTRRFQGAHKALWDAYARAFDVFERWGLRTLADLTALSAADLAARVGQEGVLLRTFAAGIDRCPLIPDPDVPRFVERVELEWPIDDLEPLSFVFARMFEPLSLALERADRGAAAIRLDLRLTNRTTHARLLQLPAAMRDAKVLRTLLVLDLESHPPPAAIDIVTIEIDPAPGRVLQHSLLERARPSVETLATLTARLGALVGDTRSGQPVLLDSYRPDAFEMQRYAPAAPTARAQPGTGVADPLLRRFRPPVAIRVRVERGRPTWVAIDRRGMPGGDVEQSAGPWRSSGGWWEADPRQWDRDEWDVAFSDGAVCRLFRSRTEGTWFLEGVLD